MNISFLNPSILWALPVALFPLILHLFFRKNPKKYEFSDLRFINLAMEKVQNRFRLRQYLLLLVRILIIALLILFFSKPVLQFSSLEGSKAKESMISVVLAIDASYSMGYSREGKTRFEKEKALSKRIISLLSSRDRIGIISYSNRVELATPSLSNDKKYLNNIIDNLKITNRTTDLSVTWPVVKQLLGQFPQSNQTVVVLSDMASHGFSVNLPEPDAGIKVFYFKPEPADNYWVNEVKAGYDQSRKQWNIESLCSFEALKYPLNWPLSYIVNDKKTGGDILSVPSKEKVRHLFSYPGDKEDVILTVKLETDGLPCDNSYNLCLKQNKNYKTWIVDGDPKFGGVTAGSFYLKNALPDAQVISEDKVDGMELRPPGVIVLTNLRANHKNIDRFINSGGGALVFLGGHTSDEFSPEYLPANIGSKFDKPQSVSWPAENNVLNKLMPLSEFELGNITVNEGFVLQAKQGSQVLATLNSGWPYLLDSRFGDGKVVLCASTADRDWGNIVTKAVFTPLVRSLVTYLSNSEEESNVYSIKIGDSFNYKTGLQGITIVTPGGTVKKPDKNAGGIIFGETEEPGIYSLMSGGKTISRFAVNLDTNLESSLVPAEEAALKRYFSKNYLIKLDPADWENNFISILSGKDMTRVILLLILILVLLEVLLSNPISKRISK